QLVEGGVRHELGVVAVVRLARAPNAVGEILPAGTQRRLLGGVGRAGEIGGAVGARGGGGLVAHAPIVPSSSAPGLASSPPGAVASASGTGPNCSHARCP